MSLPGNGIFVVRGEMSTLITAMRRSTRWNAAAYGEEEKDGLIKLFMDLKQVLNRIEDLRLIDPNVFLAPFLEVIRTDETTGAVTSLALAAINKFLSYGLIDPTSPNLAVTVENIADAVTHARFMGTDQSSDGVTLFRVVEVLHTLMRSPEGSALTNEAVCEVMLSCFKICFEPRLNELLRRFAEQALKDMVLLLFMRLPQFSEDRSESGLLKRFQMMAAAMEKDKKQRKKQHKSSNGSNVKTTVRTERKQEVASNDEVQPQTPHTLSVQHLKIAPLATTPATPLGNILDMQGKITQTPTTTATASLVENAEATPTTTSVKSCCDDTPTETEQPQIQVELASPAQSSAPQQELTPTASASNLQGSDEYINSMGVRFTQQNSLDGSEGMSPLVPYGLPCIQELFRFLIMLCNPMDKQNTDTMMHMGLSLLTVAFEVGADNIGKYDTLLELVKDDLCRNLMSLMNSERLSIFASDLQLCFLLFESLRGHLKFQLEAYLRKLSEIIASDNPKTPYEVRELALDNLLQLCRIPGFVSEIYINYDCDLYCTDMFESLTNMLSKYTLSATNAVYSTHIIAMDTLLCIIDNIESNCIAAKNSASTDNPLPTAQPHRHSRHNSGLEGIVIDAVPNDEPKVAIENISKFLNSSSRMRLAATQGLKVPASVALTREQLSEVKQKKRVLSQGTELFNQRPDKGIQHLQEHGILNSTLDPMEVALFLRENPGLDKKMIGEYISKKKNVDSKILMNFVESFDFAGLRVDQALRLYLETFRLPGEAPLIFLVLEHFADHWHKQNGEPFANTDAAFSLAYAIIMLNMDQHNSNAKRLNVPMTQEEFMKNLRGLNDGKDYDQDMLAAIFNAIKNEEIVMPAEQTGIVRENYLWKVLLRRGLTPDGVFNYVQDASYDLEVFNIIWGASLSALSFMFDKSADTGFQRTLSGFTKSAGIAAHYQQHEDFDAIVLTLCKFTTLHNSLQQEAQTNTSAQHNEIMQAVNFGLNPKAQAALRTVFLLVHEYGDCLREGWKNILDIYLQLFKLKLLPKSLMEVEDFCEPNGKAHLILEKPSQKQEAGLFSSLYSYLSSEGQREPTFEEQEIIKIGKKCIKDCQLEQMIQETKFVHLESLQELLKAVLGLLKAPNAHKSIGLPYCEDIVVFWMEFLVRVVIHNRDRMIPLWPAVRDQMYLLLLGSASCGYDYLLNRCIVAVLKLAIYLMRNEELCPIVLQSLKMLLMLKPAIILRISKQISIGIYELLKTSAQNIHSEQDWQIIFTILECVGAGAIPPEFEDASLPLPNGAKSDGALSSEEDSALTDRGYISDSELSARQQHAEHHTVRQTSTASSPYPTSPTSENWILVNKDTDLANLSRPQSPPAASVATQAISTLVYDCKLLAHAPFALFKCWDSLAFIVRNVAHITPYNFESCVRCIRTFVEACRDGGIQQRRKFEAALAAKAQAAGSAAHKKKSANKRAAEREAAQRRPGASSNGGEGYGAEALSDSEEEDLAQRYETLSIQLLDLMYQLYTRTAQIFCWWAEESCAVPQCSALWAQGWCPLLQGIARLATDRRREVRTYAISCLQQRALLVHDLQKLSGAEWASCFQQVLFPLLNELLPDSNSVAHLDAVLLEESRIRTATIMSKVFLHHLTPLIELGTAFNELWLEILNYIEKFMKVGSDMLSEQMQEILKNMLLVMHSVRVFHHSDGSLHVALWELTWRRIGEFLPNLKEELFRNEDKSESSRPKSVSVAPSDITAVPEVTVLPQPAQAAAKAPLNTPIESPRHSIILQPPAADAPVRHSLILGDLPAAHSMPILIPPTTPATSPVPQSPTNQAASATAQPTLVQPIAIVPQPAPVPAPAAMPDLINDTSVACVPRDSDELKLATEQEHALNLAGQAASTASNCSFAIDLPEPRMEQALPDGLPNRMQQDESAAQEHWQHAQPVMATGAEQQHYLQQHYQQYYEQYQHYLLQQQHYQTLQQQQQQQQEFASTAMEASIANEATTQQEQAAALSLAASTYTVNTINGNLLATATPATATEPKTTTADKENGTEETINVPISHLIAGNQYPSLNKMPNAAIAQSFAPVYVHNELQQQQQQVGDIYDEYVQNPYNLTLQQQPTLDAHAHTTQSNTTSAANYFANNMADSAQPIPPGSEILFGQH